jgi:hypothetical protein
LAGFIATAEKWAEFSEQWAQHLSSSPRIGHFKMAEAVKLNGEFRFWKPETRDRKLEGFISILRRFAQRAINVVIDLPAYEEQIAPYLLQPMSSPYFMGAYTILSGVCLDVLDEIGRSEKIELIFDQQAIFAPRMRAWYPLVKDLIEHSSPELQGMLPLTPIFKDDKEFLPLQASDVIAWLFRMACSGQRNRFEWIADELSPAIPMSKYSNTFESERMGRIYAQSLNVKFPPALVGKWRDSIGLGTSRTKPRTKKR